jgi:hypothetical protein
MGEPSRRPPLWVLVLTAALAALNLLAAGFHLTVGTPVVGALNIAVGTWLAYRVGRASDV